MALIAACVLEPGIYFAMNSPTALIGTTPETAAAAITGWGFAVTPDMLTDGAATSAKVQSCRAPAARRHSQSAWRRS